MVVEYPVLYEETLTMYLYYFCSSQLDAFSCNRYVILENTDLSSSSKFMFLYFVK